MPSTRRSRRDTGRFVGGLAVLGIDVKPVGVEIAHGTGECRYPPELGAVLGTGRCGGPLQDRAALERLRVALAGSGLDALAHRAEHGFDISQRCGESLLASAHARRQPAEMKRHMAQGSRKIGVVGPAFGDESDVLHDFSHQVFGYSHRRSTALVLPWSCGKNPASIAQPDERSIPIVLPKHPKARHDESPEEASEAD